MIESDTSVIVLSHHYDREGKHYVPGDSLALPTPDARSLVSAGYAKALMTPMVDDDPNGTTKVRSAAATRLTTAGGTTYAWAHEGEAIAVRNPDVEAVLALPGFTLADPPEQVKDPTDTNGDTWTAHDELAPPVGLGQTADDDLTD